MPELPQGAQDRQWKSCMATVVMKSGDLGSANVTKTRIHQGTGIRIIVRGGMSRATLR